MLKNYRDYSWILKGKQRKRILKVMDKPLIPTQIKEKTDLSLNNVSDILREFRKRNLAECITLKRKQAEFMSLQIKERD